jgi:hypothetical protein
LSHDLDRGFFMRITALRFGVAALVAAASISSAPAAVAKEGDVIVTGACSGESTWKVKLRALDGMIRVWFEVDTDVVGEDWQFLLKANGRRILKGIRTTVEPSGSFQVSRMIADGEGTETITASATNLATGETCSGAASF